MVQFTDSVVRAAKEGTTIWDSSQAGFGLRTGKRKKTFLVLIASGRRQTIGHYPLMSLADARKEARRILAEKELGQIRPTFTAFEDAKSQFLTDCETRNKSRTIRDYTRLLTKHYPFGRKSVGDITPRQILKNLQSLPPSEKHHAFVVGKLFFTWCVRNHILDRSPMENMQPPKNGKPRERILSSDELQAVLMAAKAGNTPFHHIVLLCLYTGLRRGEVASLQWDWIENDLLTVPAYATKNGVALTIPLCPTVLSLFDTIPRLEGVPYVFPASRTVSDKTTVFNGWGKPKASFDKECGVTGWQIHDCRRTFASGMQMLGVRLEVTEALLNHTSGSRAGVVGIYQRYNYADEKREAILLWEAHLSKLLVA